MSMHTMASAWPITVGPPVAINDVCATLSVILVYTYVRKCDSLLIPVLYSGLTFLELSGINVNVFVLTGVCLFVYEHF